MYFFSASIEFLFYFIFLIFWEINKLSMFWCVALGFNCCNSLCADSAGDLERKLNLEISPLCDRQTDSVPAVQIGELQTTQTHTHKIIYQESSGTLQTSRMYNRERRVFRFHLIHRGASVWRVAALHWAQPAQPVDDEQPAQEQGPLESSPMRTHTCRNTTWGAWSWGKRRRRAGHPLITPYIHQRFNLSFYREEMTVYPFYSSLSLLQRLWDGESPGRQLGQDTWKNNSLCWSMGGTTLCKEKQKQWRDPLWGKKMTILVKTNANTDISALNEWKKDVLEWNVHS